MRLIDADALPSVKFHALPYTHITPSDVNAESYKRGWNDAIDAIVDCMPTIDAVPVVRCRECAAYRSMEKSGGLCKNTGFWVPENGFCHDGERKDGGVDNG